MARSDQRHATVRWDPQHRRLHLLWRGFAEGEAYRAAMAAALDVVIAQRGVTWISDRRLLGVVRADDQQWLHDEWFPRAAGSTLRRVALLTPPTALARMGVRCHVASTTPGPTAHPLEVSWFEGLPAAQRWLDEPTPSAERRGPRLAA